MRSTNRTIRVRRAAMVGLLVAGLLGAGTAEAPVRAYPSATVKLVGHGFGHGRGMGQFGALGYALAGWSHTQILDHFYGGTVGASGSNIPMSVHLQRCLKEVVTCSTTADGGDTIVMQERGHMTTSAGPGTFTALRAVPLGGNSYRVDSAPSCAGPWAVGAVSPAVVGPVYFSPQNVNDDVREMIQVCEAWGTRWVRGSVGAVMGAGLNRNVNYLPIEAYLRGVVPRESPANWGALGGGRGMEALKAQAVAARSYAQASTFSSWAKACDDQRCQVYGGRAVRDSNGFRDLEGVSIFAATDQAVASTARQVRAVGSVIARTEFSSSSGGHTAGGTFTAVVDEGDATPQNPNHSWTAEIAVSAIEAAYPEIGALQTVDVTKRNGLGDFGGRVLEVALRGSRGTKLLTGDAMRTRFGLKSNWFALPNVPSGGVNGYWQVGTDGGIFSFGNAPFYGSTGGMRLNRPVVGLAATPSGNGYWLVASDGGIFAYGDARFFGSTGGMRLNQPVVGMAPTPSGNGYWLVASDGGIFAYGDAKFFGSTGGIRLNQPVVGMASTPSGQGYWLVARDGGIFAYGDAAFAGSTGGLKLNQPVVGMAPAPTGGGYWLLGGDGGIFAFNVPFHGSLPGARIPGPAVGMRATTTGGGYVIATSGGRVHSFGDAPNFGDIRTLLPAFRGAVQGIEVHRGP